VAGDAVAQRRDLPVCPVSVFELESKRCRLLLELSAPDFAALGGACFYCD